MISILTKTKIHSSQEKVLLIILKFNITTILEQLKEILYGLKKTPVSINLCLYLLYIL